MTTAHTKAGSRKICCAMCEVGPSSITDTRGAASSGAKHPDAVEIVAGILGETLVPSGVHHRWWGEPSYRGGRVTGATNRAEAAAGRRFRRPWGRAPRLEAAARTADGRSPGNRASEVRAEQGLPLTVRTVEVDVAVA